MRSTSIDGQALQPFVVVTNEFAICHSADSVSLGCVRFRKMLPDVAVTTYSRPQGCA